jgi:hypothetical protein
MNLKFIANKYLSNICDLPAKSIRKENTFPPSRLQYLLIRRHSSKFSASCNRETKNGMLYVVPPAKNSAVQHRVTAENVLFGSLKV